MSMSDVLRLEQESPADWGARVDYDSWSSAGPKDDVTLHWPARGRYFVNRALEQGHHVCHAEALAIEDGHLQKGWQGGGYNYLLCPHGNLLRMRGAARGAHNPEDSDGDGHPDNVDSVGVCLLIGTFDKPTDEQLATVTAVGNAMAKNRSDFQMWPHKHARQTDCPGPDLTTFAYGFTPTTEETPMPDDSWTDKWPTYLRQWAVEAKNRGLITVHTDPNRPVGEMPLGEFLVLRDRALREDV